jgi:hypothetical protein
MGAVSGILARLRGLGSKRGAADRLPTPLLLSEPLTSAIRPLSISPLEAEAWRRFRAITLHDADYTWAAFIAMLARREQELVREVGTLEGEVSLLRRCEAFVP